MKRLLSSLILGMLLMGCTSGEEGSIKVDPSSVEPIEERLEDIVDTHGDIQNLERFEEFIQHVENLQSDHIRIISYTTEGDPIVKEIEFTGELFELVYDTRRDAFGSQIIRTYTCTAIDREGTHSSSRFQLTGCEGEDTPIFLLETTSN